jgi:hypothetical protein
MQALSNISAAVDRVQQVIGSIKLDAPPPADNLSHGLLDPNMVPILPPMLNMPPVSEPNLPDFMPIEPDMQTFLMHLLFQVPGSSMNQH